jgi:hypothetical protein
MLNINEKITNMDLIKNMYDINILQKNIEHLNKKIVLSTQKLDADFCVKYIYDGDIDSGSEDSYIFDKFYILERQNHITDEEFDKAFSLFYNDDKTNLK